VKIIKCHLKLLWRLTIDVIPYNTRYCIYTRGLLCPTFISQRNKGWGSGVIVRLNIRDYRRQTTDCIRYTRHASRYSVLCAYHIMWNDCLTAGLIGPLGFLGECYRGRSMFQVRWTGALRIIDSIRRGHLLQTSYYTGNAPRSRYVAF
jgi:hypothetical protein